MNVNRRVTSLAAVVGRHIQETYFVPTPFGHDDPQACLEIVPMGPLPLCALRKLRYEAVIPCDESFVRIGLAVVDVEKIAAEPPHYRLMLAPIRGGRDDNRNAFVLAARESLARGRHWFQDVRTIRLCNPSSPDDSCPFVNEAYEPSPNVPLAEVIGKIDRTWTESSVEELTDRIDRIFQDLTAQPDYPEIEIILDEAG